MKSARAVRLPTIPEAVIDQANQQPQSPTIHEASRAPARVGTSRIVSFSGAKDRRDARKVALLAALERGVPIRVACRAAGIGAATGHRWRQEDPAFAAAFAEAVELGLQSIEARILEIGLTSDWRALVRYLEVRCPERWGRKTICACCQRRDSGGAREKLHV